MAFPLTTTATLTTAAAPAAIWHAFERVDLWPTALPAVAAAELEPPGPLAPDSLIVTRATAESRSADITYRVVAAEAPRRLVLAVDDPDYRATTEYQIVSEARGTDVIVTSRLEAVGLVQTLRFIVWRERLTPVLGATARERTAAFLALAARIDETG